MTLPTWLRWSLLAVLGLVVAAGISFAASQLVSEQIGLTSEPLSAGRDLAPREQGRDSGRQDSGKPQRHPGSPDRTTSTTTTPASTTTIPPTTKPPPATTPPATGAGSNGEPEPEHEDD